MALDLAQRSFHPEALLIQTLYEYLSVPPAFGNVKSSSRRLELVIAKNHVNLLERERTDMY